MWLTALSFARMVPWWLWGFAALLAWGSWHKYRGAAAAEIKRENAVLIARAAAASRVQGAADDATRQARTLAVESRAAAVAGTGLRVRAAAAVASAAGSCETAADTARVLADVLASVEERGRRMAEVADERGTAGTACERAFEAVGPPR